jgi:hypothetical protein
VKRKENEQKRQARNRAAAAAERRRVKLILRAPQQHTDEDDNNDVTADSAGDSEDHDDRDDSADEQHEPELGPEEQTQAVTQQPAEEEDNEVYPGPVPLPLVYRVVAQGSWYMLEDGMTEVRGTESPPLTFSYAFLPLLSLRSFMLFSYKPLASLKLSNAFLVTQVGVSGFQYSLSSA